MFEDILGEKEYNENVDPKSVRIGLNNDKSDPPSCKNCKHGSHILSNYPDKVLCQKYRRHKDLDYKCRNWELRK